LSVKLYDSENITDNYWKISYNDRYGMTDVPYRKGDCDEKY